MRDVNSTSLFYEYLTVIEQHFNRALFDGKLPSPLLSLKRGLGCLGHFKSGQWQPTSGKAIGEITLDPSLFAQHSWLSLLQTFAHQQCHLWQLRNGSPGRSGYHNTEWAAKMENIGLMSSTTGLPDGGKTGQRIQEFAIPDGPFILACAELVEHKLKMPLAGRFSPDVDIVVPPVNLKLPKRTLARLCAPVGVVTKDPVIANLEDLRVKKRKVKYSCPKCTVIVWGRSGLGIQCQKCNRRLVEDVTDDGVEKIAARC